MTSRAYWKRRALLLEQLLYNRSSQTISEISQLLDSAIDEINDEIKAIYAVFGRKGGLTQSQVMQLMSEQQTAETRAYLQAAYETASGPAKQDIWNRLAAPGYAARVSYLQAAQDRVYTQARILGIEEIGAVQRRLADTLEQSYYRSLFDIQQFTGDYFDFSTLSDTQLAAALSADWSGENWSDRIWNNNQEFADSVQATVTAGLLAGLRYDEMADNLLTVAGATSAHGAKYNAARLIRTECNYVANQGHLLGYREAEIEEYTFLATLDLRTTPWCRELDMKSFPISEAVPGTNLPPMHPNCRSTTFPKASKEKLQARKRAARDPITGKYMTVPATMTYQEWYEKYVDGKK